MAGKRMMTQPWEEVGKGEEFYKKCHDRIRKTLDFMANQPHNDWRRYIAMYEGDHWGAFSGRYTPAEVSAQKPRSLITVNQSGESADRMLAYLIGSDFKALCMPRRQQDDTPARLAEAVLNSAWERVHARPQIRRAALAAITTGRGWIYVGFKRTLEDSMTDKDGNFLTYEQYIKEEDVYVEEVSPFHMLWDLTAGHPYHGRWIARLYFKAPIDIMENPDYDQSVIERIRKRDISPINVNDRTATPQSPWRFGGSEVEEEPKWTVAEFWDKKYRTKTLYLLGIDDPIRKPEPWWDHLVAPPFFTFDYTESLWTPFPIGMMKWIEDLQYERDRSRTQMFEHRRTILGGRFVYSQDVDDKELQKWLDGDKAIKVPNPSADIRAMEIPPIPPDEYRVDGLCREDINSSSYIADLLRGAAGADRESATSANARSQFAMQVIEEKKSNFQYTIRQILGQMLAHMKAFYEKEQVVRVAGAEGEYWGSIINNTAQQLGMPGVPPGANGEYWIPFTREDITDQVDVEIEAVPKAPPDPSAERQADQAEFQFLMNPNQIPIFSALGVNYVQYVRNFFRKYGQKDAVRWLPSLNTAQLPIPPQQTEAEAGQVPPQAAPAAPPPAAPGAATLQQQNVAPMSPLQGAFGAMGNPPEQPQ